MRSLLAQQVELDWSTASLCILSSVSISVNGFLAEHISVSIRINICKHDSKFLDGQFSIDERRHGTNIGATSKRPMTIISSISTLPNLEFM